MNFVREGMQELKEMVDFRACPRCKGDLHLNRDVYGRYRECLQCGYMEDIEERSRFERLVFVDVQEEVA